MKRVAIRTPKGTFASAAQAAAAMHCDKSTILNRCRTDPDNYQRLESSTTDAAPARDPAQGWNHYRFLPDDEREARYQAWCRRNGRDPEADGTADDFIESLDTDEDLAVDDLEELDEQS